jgi:hypothetical protein
MPLKRFKCPDDIERLVSYCLANCPRKEGRCLSLPTLTTIGHIRIWNGTPSTTQCLNPTRIEYLQIKHDYAVDPFDQAFSLLGTRHHGRLEQVAKKIEGLQSELYLKGEVSGILDLLEPINGGDNYRLIDYKTFGSYSVAKHLGLKTNSEADIRKLALQMNNYRLMAQVLGFNVTELKVQITVRDGNTRSARYNGVDKNIYLLPVEILPDIDVEDYFLTKSIALCQAVEKDELPEWCGYEDTWASRRCKGFCPVYMYCPEGAKLNKVKLVV